MGMALLFEYGLQLLGRPYIFGGDDPMTGYDCSGVVQEILTAGGAHPKPGSDLTAQGLFDALYPNARRDIYALGSLAFFGKSLTEVKHVAFMMDEYSILEAGGGTSMTTTEALAKERNAFIRIRTLKYRKDLIAVLRPNYSAIGVLK